MSIDWKKGIWTSLKITAVAGVFCLVQHQIITLRTELSGNGGSIAMAVGRYQAEIEEARDALEGALEDSQEQLHTVRRDLEESARRWESNYADLTRLIAHREEKLHSVYDVEFVRYQGALKEALGRVKDSQARLRSIEDKVQGVLPQDPRLKEEAMIYPTIQLKGDGTVGSGVIIYSRGGEDGKEARVAGASTGATTFAITACHVVMEILGDRFPAAPLEETLITGSDEAEPSLIVSATVEIFDRDLDLALLRLNYPEKFSHIARLLPRDEVQGLRIFTPVYAVGCPLGNKPLSTSGELTSRAKVVGSQLFWMINAPTFFGNSGGGVYRAKDCRLIGISSMIYTYGKSHPVVVPHMGLFVPLDVIYDWLENQGYGFIARGESEPATKEVTSLSRKIKDKLQMLNDGLRSLKLPAAESAAGR